MNKDRFSDVFSEISNHLKSADLTVVEGLNHICTVLRKTFAHYDWVGFYFADLEKKRANRDADPAWADYQERTEGLVASQENKLCKPMEWSEIK